MPAGRRGHGQAGRPAGEAGAAWAPGRGVDHPGQAGVARSASGRGVPARPRGNGRNGRDWRDGRASGHRIAQGGAHPGVGRGLAGAAEPQPRDAVDVAVAEELAEWQPLVDPLIEPVRRLLAECADLDEFLRRLPEAVAGQDVAALTEHLAKLTFAARLAGETGAGLGD
ncbi:DUF935 family protein [Desulfolutivibrio sulfodismutans DSM 3696]|nr:DUF935 family protein [Desulfolutivibrio sulfodismutans DSM 3696]